MEDFKPRYLVMVTSSANNNKYYHMNSNGDGTWTAEYGRVGSSPQRRTYGMSQWNSKYNEKLRKGYVDQTDLIEDLIKVEKPKAEKKYKNIENAAIAEIVERLQSMARKTISDNYTVKSNSVTQAMIDEAQKIITSLIDIDDVSEFNDALLKLFVTIPRKMENVSSYIARSKDDFNAIIKKEQDLLDVMQGQVVQHIAEEPEDEDAPVIEHTILEQLGIEFEECDDKDIAVIKSALNESAHKFKRAWRVKNLKTQKRYDDFVKNNNIMNTKLLFHGSRNENWWSILNTGLVLRPTNAIITGKCYGYGLYFAPKAQKSIGYTSLSGSYWAKGSSNSAFMALMQVAYGNPYDVYDFNYKYQTLDYDKLQDCKKGANCLHAHAGADLGYSTLRNDEIVVYKEEQCTIKYLVEIQ